MVYDGMTLSALRTAVATKSYMPTRAALLLLIDMLAIHQARRSNGRGLLVAIMISAVCNGGLVLWIARSLGWL